MMKTQTVALVLIKHGRKQLKLFWEDSHLQESGFADKKCTRATTVFQSARLGN